MASHVATSMVSAETSSKVVPWVVKDVEAKLGRFWIWFLKGPYEAIESQQGTSVCIVGSPKAGSMDGTATNA